MQQNNTPEVNAAYADQIGIPGKVAKMVKYCYLDDPHGNGLAIELSLQVSLTQNQMNGLLVLVRDIELSDVCHDAVAYCNSRYIETRPGTWLDMYTRERHSH